MALDVALQGKRYPPVRFAVEGERVDAFARAVAQRVEGVPPTFATVPEIAAGLANVLDDPELALDLSAILHGEQEYVWNRPLRIGERLTASSTIESIRGKGAMWFLVLSTVLRDEAGDDVVLGRSTVIVREGA